MAVAKLRNASQWPYTTYVQGHLHSHTHLNPYTLLHYNNNAMAARSIVCEYTCLCVCDTIRKVQNIRYFRHRTYVCIMYIGDAHWARGRVSPRSPYPFLSPKNLGTLVRNSFVTWTAAPSSRLCRRGVVQTEREKRTHTLLQTPVRVRDVNKKKKTRIEKKNENKIRRTIA